jgi:hypothetical protein
LETFNKATDLLNMTAGTIRISICLSKEKYL